MRAERNRRAGLSFAEVLVASVILSTAILAGLTTYQHRMREAAELRGRAQIAQVEQTIQRGVGSLLRAFYLAMASATPPCDPVANPLFGGGAGSTTFSSGLNAQLLTPSLAGQMLSGDRRTVGDRGADRYRAALTRCRSSVAGNLTSGYFTGQSGLYLCLLFDAAASAPPVVTATVAPMRPLIGEFYYVNYLLDAPHPAAPQPPEGVFPMGAIGCPELSTILKTAAPPPRPTQGILYYTLYWQGRAGNDTAHRSKNGIVYMAN